jgi:hypothetical protein
MSLNGSGIRDIARVLHISPGTVTNELKKESELKHVNVAACHEIYPEDVTVEVHKVKSAEMDEIWSFVGEKERQHWLWHAIAHISGVILAYICRTGETNSFYR